MGGNLKMKIFVNYLKTLTLCNNFSTPRTPKQNDLVERKNRALQEMTRTTLKVNSTLKHSRAKHIKIKHLFIRNYV